MNKSVSPAAYFERRIIRWLSLVIGLSFCFWMLWEARSLLLPCLASALLAYACDPAVEFLERRRIPRSLAIAVLILSALAAVIGTMNAIRTAAPSPEGVTELKVRAVHAINTHYSDLMGLPNGMSAGNRFYQFFRSETDPQLKKINRILALTPEEERLLVSRTSTDEKWRKLLRQHLEDNAMLERSAQLEESKVTVRHDDSNGLAAGQGAIDAPLGAIAHALPHWVAAFLMFVFILMDRGEIKRGLLSLVSNRFFEPVLSILSDIETTMRQYARALFTQCVLLGGTVSATLALAGIPFKWAAVIGFFSGMSNVMPYAGIAAALLGGLSYAALADDIRSPFSFVNESNFYLAILAAVLLTDAIKNIVYDPLVLGGALKLQPVVIVLGVAVGATIFGLLGALFAVPAIALVRALVGSVLRQLRAYGEI